MLPPLDDTTTIDQLTLDPYPIYRRMRAQTPVIRVASAQRTFVVKYDDTKMVKDDPELFSSDDPLTPMQPAFRAHTLMRKDGAEHVRERMAMKIARKPRAGVRHVERPDHAAMPEVAHARKRGCNEAVQELVHLHATQGNSCANGHVLAQLEV